MDQYLAEDLIAFLKVTDRHLVKRYDLIIIGGAAASIAYGVTRTTSDIDLANEIPAELEKAMELARTETGFSIPISHVGVFEPPYNYENRISQLDKSDFKNLRLFVPERHDLALMKMVRGYENDIQAIEEIHQAAPFEFDILVDRFMNEMTQAIGRPGEIRLNFLLMIETLFGNELTQEADRITKKWGALKA
ncbi:MAG: DUF6036 family nucleotidyltransferase [Xanthomonadales bacterium]|nr:DUF6036 family nucleotidyltransferase [Xanthomonadales bacterium]